MMMSVEELMIPVVWSDILAVRHQEDPALPAFGQAVRKIAPQLFALLLNGAETANTEISAPLSMFANQWRSELGSTDLVIGFFAKDQDHASCFLAIKADLVFNALARYLGSTAPFKAGQNPRQLSSTEMRYAGHIAPAAALAVQPLTNVCLSAHQVWSAQDWKEPTSQPLCTCVISLADEPYFGSVRIAVPAAALSATGIAAASDEAVAEAPNRAMISELVRTQVKMDIIVRLADITLQRIRSLCVGDLIELSSSGLREARAVSRGLDLFSGQIGRSGNAYSIKLLNSSLARAWPAKSAASAAAGKIEKTTEAKST
jgi:flagellar motor switch protein FliM